MSSAKPLLEKLDQLRHKQVAVAMGTGLAIAVAVSLELLALALFIDWWLELPWTVRLISLLAQAGILAYILLRRVLLPWWRQPDEDALALAVEKARPEFQTRLIASVQLARPGAVPAYAAASLVDALVNQTQTLARAIDFRAIVPTDRLKTLGLTAAVVLTLALAGYVAGGVTCRDLLKRAFLSQIPVPRKTRVLVPDGNKIVGLGDNVRLEAFAEGVLPAEGKLVVQYRQRRVLEYALEQNRDDPSHFGRTLENVQDSFTYRIHLNDNTSPEFQVQAIPRPTTAAVLCRQEFPAYTGLAAVPKLPGDLTLLAGSILHLQLTATKDLQQAALRLVGPEERIPLEISPTNNRALSGSFTVPAKGLNGFTVHLLDTENMESRDNAVFRVEIVPDKPPVVRLTLPERKEELVTRQASLLVGMDITDDFKINQVRLRYRVDTAAEGSEKTVELDLGGETPKRLQRVFPWNLAKLDPPPEEGNQIEFWIEAVDNNNATGPGIAASEHRIARVVTREEKLADALNRANDFLNGIEDIAEDQAQANRQLGAIILEKR